MAVRSKSAEQPSSIDGRRGLRDGRAMQQPPPDDEIGIHIQRRRHPRPSLITADLLAEPDQPLGPEEHYMDPSIMPRRKSGHQRPE
jgi:hypothetical protein